MVDRVCNNFFEGNREYYVESEYDQDGVLGYEPPPLVEVWLSEQEKHDCFDSLAKQRRLIERRQKLQSC